MGFKIYNLKFWRQYLRRSWKVSGPRICSDVHYGLRGIIYFKTCNFLSEFRFKIALLLTHKLMMNSTLDYRKGRACARASPLNFKMGLKITDKWARDEITGEQTGHVPRASEQKKKRVSNEGFVCRLTVEMWTEQNSLKLQIGKKIRLQHKIANG